MIPYQTYFDPWVHCIENCTNSHHLGHCITFILYHILKNSVVYANKSLWWSQFLFSGDWKLRKRSKKFLCCLWELKFLLVIQHNFRLLGSNPPYQATPSIMYSIDHTGGKVGALNGIQFGKSIFDNNKKSLKTAWCWVDLLTSNLSKYCIELNIGKG